MNEHTAEKDAIRWVVFCAMYPGEERLFNDRSTSELRRMNSKAAGIADALWIAGARVEADQTHPIPPGLSDAKTEEQQ